MQLNSHFLPSSSTLLSHLGKTNFPLQFSKLSLNFRLQGHHHLHLGNAIFLFQFAKLAEFSVFPW
uniref:Uncharacterized protein n=1 Tax=Rhizophora mucronata TaxID=61149 RepID=A0A2P2MNW4_RHIMU